MAFFKCKICGGELDVNENISAIECDWCVTKAEFKIQREENLIVQGIIVIVTAFMPGGSLLPFITIFFGLIWNLIGIITFAISKAITYNKYYG